ncbi:oligosaccharide flippase family protein [Stigmatella sp. ncwal1]|uniref:Oligosaccharide flippase family protein n=1 Tax=Stigmatella ashevillensis TaxID=2995309 RepID=A0ABT5DIK4_9BACT|nr:oligosaccharide flippase family protein [Stigmatella ashevillena]MDC0713361.1 oligosaccharide flippase family protein [Stigmatella ashevillena]
MNATDTPEVSSSEVKARAQKGIVVLLARTVASQGLRVISALCLSRLLFPGDYGLFGIVAYATSLGVFLGDLGLSAALVRQAHEPTEDETSTIFWCHQGLTAVIVATVMALAPILVEGYALGAQALPMVYTMTLGLFFSSLRVIPLMMLERKLAFPVIARAELIENVAQVVTTIGLASLGVGAWALVGGGLVRGAVGLGCIWWASPWKPRGAFRLDVVRRLLGYGLGFQLPPLVGAVSAGFIPLVVGHFLGKEAVGLVNWAWALASTPMMLSIILNRVAFPAYCRLQDDPAGFADYLRTSLRRLSAVLCLFIPLAVLAVPVAVPLFFGERWVPAVPLVQWFSLECVLTTLTGLLATAQNASGRPWERLAVTVGVGLTRWALGAWLVHRFGLAGIGPLGLIVGLGELWVTAWRVTQLNAALRGLVAEVVEPVVTVSLLLLGAFVAAPFVSKGLLAQALVGAAVFAGLVLLREQLPGPLPLVAELRAIIALVSARRARVAPQEPSP